MMGISSARFRAKRAAVWCKADTRQAANITPELPAETTVGTDGGGPLTSLAHGWWGRAAGCCTAGNESGTAEVVAPLSLRETGAFFILLTNGI